MSEFNFGKNLKKIRQSKDISQAEMALKLGIAQSTYSRIESGLTIPSQALISKMAEELDVLETRLTGPEPAPPVAATAVPMVNRTSKPVILIAIIAFSIALVSSAHTFVQYLCIDFGASDTTNYVLRMGVSIGLIVYIVHCVKKWFRSVEN